MSTKYLSSGQHVNIVRRIDDEGSIVELCYKGEVFNEHGDSGEAEAWGDPIYIENKELFDKPPTAKIHESIADLSSQIKNKRLALVETSKLESDASQKVIDAERKLSLLDREYRKALDSLPISMETIGDVRALMEADHVIAVRSANYDSDSYYAITFPEYIESRFRTEIVLTGGSSGFEWKFKASKEHNGYGCRLFSSKTDADVFFKQQLVFLLEKATPDKSSYSKLLKLMGEHKLEIPAHKLAAWESYKENEWQSKRDEIINKKADLDAELAKLGCSNEVTT